MRTTLLAIIFSSFLLFLAAPQAMPLANAQAPVELASATITDSPIGLIECGIRGKDIPCGKGENQYRIAVPCTACDLFFTISRVTNFIWWVAVSLATVMLIWGGGLMVASGFTLNASMNASGKTVIKNALIGIVIIFFAWMLIDVIIKILAKDQSVESGTTAELPRIEGKSVKFGPWNKLDCVSVTPETICPEKRPPPPTGGAPTEPTAVPIDTGPGHFKTETEARVFVNTLNEGNPHKIKVNKNPCRGRHPSQISGGCTDLVGIRIETLRWAGALRDECKCDVMITGGTELGHASETNPAAKSHRNGWKLDLRDEAGVSKHIWQTFTPAGSRDGDPVMRDGNVECVYEQSAPKHWDCTVN